MDCNFKEGKSLGVDDYENRYLPADLNTLLKETREIMGQTTDLMIEEVNICGINCALLCCEAMASTANMTQLLFEPLMKLRLEGSLPEELMEHVRTRLVMGFDQHYALDYALYLRLIMSGFVLLVVDGCPGAAAFGLQGFAQRGVDGPSGEKNIKGAKDGFVETIRVNISLVRRRIKSPSLRFQMFQLGSQSKTDVCLAWMDGKVSPGLLKAVKKRLDGLDAETVLSSGYVQPYLEGRRGRIFSSVGTTQRPDTLCARILEGRVGLFIDGTPFVLVIPTLFIEHFQTLDDYNARPYFATFLRWVKYFAFLIALLLPGGYVAVANFHPELLNDTLLMNLVSAESAAPFPLALEAGLLLIMFEIIKEAGLRLPEAIGGTVSLVGGIIIGDAAVSTGLVSTPLMIMVALSVTASFVAPEITQPITVLRLVFVVLGGIGGLYAIGLGLGLVLINCCGMDDFGIPHMAPVSPFTPSAMRDVAVREDFTKMAVRNMTIEQMKGTEIPGDKNQ